ncbi:MAG: hypothetical protein AAB664_02335 [Patescibacteria group bacterium]
MSIKQWEKDVPYRHRQVYAAFAKVDVSVCKVCPYFRPIENPDAGQQPGICCYCRAESKLYDMHGEPVCANK